MKKYLLLRDNRESGPHTIEQMGSIGLHPLDLIWVENESTSWKYPEEIEELKAFISHDLTSEPRQLSTLGTERVFVALPSGDIKDEEDRSFYQQSLPIDNTYLPVEEESIKPAQEFQENYRTHTYKEPVWQPRLFRSKNAASIIAIFIGVMIGSFVIKRWVDGYVPNDEDSVVATPLMDQDMVKQQDESIHNALVTEVVPVYKSTPVKKAKKASLKSQLKLATNNYRVGLFGGINGLQLTVFNTSSQTIDKVIVALDYLKPNGSVVESENIPFPSIKPKAAETIPIPPSNRGVKVRYKILKVYAHNYKEDLKEI